jgi:hypothetical protein
MPSINAKLANARTPSVCLLWVLPGVYMGVFRLVRIST